MDQNLANEVENLNGIPEEMKEKMSNLIKSLDKIESIFEKADKTNAQDIHDRISPLEAAQYDWINIYTLNALYYAYLKTNGLLTKDHPLVSELARIKDYMKRIDTIKKNEEDKKKSRLVLDKDASSRIIKRSLWQNASNQSEKSEGEPKSKKLK